MKVLKLAALGPSIAIYAVTSGGPWGRYRGKPWPGGRGPAAAAGFVHSAHLALPVTGPGWHWPQQTLQFEQQGPVLGAGARERRTLYWMKLEESPQVLAAHSPPDACTVTSKQWGVQGSGDQCM